MEFPPGQSLRKGRTGPPVTRVFPPVRDPYVERDEQVQVLQLELLKRTVRRGLRLHLGTGLLVSFSLQ